MRRAVSRKGMAPLALVLCSLFFGTTGADASTRTLSATWRAPVGISGANGTVIFTTYTNGTGSVSVSLHRLRRYTYYSDWLGRGTCSRPVNLLIRLPAFRTTWRGTIARTTNLTAAQVRTVKAAMRYGRRIRFRVGRGSLARCGNFSRLYTPAPTTTAPTPVPVPTPTPVPTPAPTPSSTGRVFYMSPSGSDTASGSIESPFKTFRDWVGATSLQPGDTIFARGGTYYSPTGAGETWRPSNSGTASAPITIKAYPGETPIFDGQNAVPQALVLVGVKYLTFEGLTFTRYRPVGNGVVIVSASDHITFSGIHATANAGSDSATDQFLYISNGSYNVLIDAVSVTGTTAAAVMIGGGTTVSNVIVRNSHLYGNGRGIIDGDISVGTRITGNVIENNSMAQVHFHSNGTGHGSTDAVMAGNTLRGSVGLWVEALSYSPIAESNDCVTSATPFTTGWPLSSGTTYSLATWQATGRGAGDTVGVCP